MVGYGPFSLWVIHKEGLCPSSGDINRLMMIIMIVTEEVMERVCAVSAEQRSAAAAPWEAVAPAPLVALLLRCDVRCLLLLLHYAHSILFCRQLLGNYIFLQIQCMRLIISLKVMEGLPI
jgi:hypothetical protein